MECGQLTHNAHIEGDKGQICNIYFPLRLAVRLAAPREVRFERIRLSLKIASTAANFCGDSIRFLFCWMTAR